MPSGFLSFALMCAVNRRFYPLIPRVLCRFFLFFHSSLSLYLSVLHFLLSSIGFSFVVVVRSDFSQFLPFRFAKLFLSISSFSFREIISGETRSLMFAIIVGCSSLFLAAIRTLDQFRLFHCFVSASLLREFLRIKGIQVSIFLEL